MVAGLLMTQGLLGGGGGGVQVLWRNSPGPRDLTNPEPKPLTASGFRFEVFVPDP